MIPGICNCNDFDDQDTYECDGCEEDYPESHLKDRVLCQGCLERLASYDITADRLRRCLQLIAQYESEFVQMAALVQATNPDIFAELMKWIRLKNMLLDDLMPREVP